MATYQSELTNQEYVPNVVVRIMGDYFCIREPDSGISIPSAYRGTVRSLNLNPTQIDPFNATTTINNNSISILDYGQIVTQKFASNPQIFQGELCEIWLGRSFVGMDFADYLKVTDTYITKVSKQDNSYNFSTKEAKDRLTTGAFNTQAKLGADILAATTTITLQDASVMPTSGLFKLNNEYISYNGISGNNLLNCIRGEEGSVASNHELGDDILLAEVVQDNPVTLLLQLLISSGGGGTYDVLNDGAGISQTLIDVTEFEYVRDEYFTGETFKFILYSVTSLRKFIETEILYPRSIRLRANNNGKIGLAVLDKPTLNIDAPTLDHTNITKIPQFDVEESKIYNQLNIEWNYDDTTGKYLNLTTYQDASSIAQFGKKDALNMKFQGIRASLGGLLICDEIAETFFNRFAFPKPLISLAAHMEASVWLLGEKATLETTLLPTSAGDLNFGDTLEVMQRAINYQTGDVQMKLSFNSMTGLRACFLAPSDTIGTVTNQATVVLGAGRGDNYRVGWKMRLYDNVARDYASTQVNEIQSISGDTITFTSNWSTTLLTTHRIMFADYDQVVDQQKKFCFISDDGNNFTDGKPAFIISY